MFAIVVVTGVLSALLLVPLSSLLTTDYGRFLIVKAALVAVVAALAIAGRVALGRPAAPAPGAGQPRVTRIECAALAAVLVVTGLLTVITPPGRPIFGRASPAATHAHHASRPGNVTGAGHNADS